MNLAVDEVQYLRSTCFSPPDIELQLDVMLSGWTVFTPQTGTTEAFRTIPGANRVLHSIDLETAKKEKNNYIEQGPKDPRPDVTWL